MIRFVAVGDLMLGDSSSTVGFGIHSRYAGRTIAEVFSDLAPLLAGADVVLGNLECSLSPVGVGDSRWARDQMRGDVVYATAIREAGFTSISIGNNHAMQHGDAGFAATVRALRDAGLHVIGLRGSPPWACDPVRTESSTGSSVTVLGYSWRPRQYGMGQTPYADAPLEAVLRDIIRAAATSDVVIVSLHWGDEFVSQPSEADVAAARAMIAAGASCLVGHHPHVTRPVVTMSDRLVAFSLGNAVSDMLWMPALREGYLLDTVLGDEPSVFRVTRLHTDSEYRIRLGGEVPASALALVPLATGQYREAVQRGLSSQRAAQYSYLLKNATRLASGVLSTLIATTVRNKWRTIVDRIRDMR